MTGFSHVPDPRHPDVARAQLQSRQAAAQGRGGHSRHRDRRRGRFFYNAGLWLIVVGFVGGVVWWLAG